MSEFGKVVMETVGEAIDLTFKEIGKKIEKNKGFEIKKVNKQ